VIFLPFCEPIHPLFGAENCETYSYSFYGDAIYLQTETYVSLPNFSRRVRTDIYTYKMFPRGGARDYQNVGVRFEAPNLVGEAFSRRNAYGEDYAFGLYGRWRGWGGYAYKAREYPYSGEGIFVSYARGWFSATGGWAEGGPSAGFQLGGKYYLTGKAYAGKDTLVGVGLGTTGRNYDIFAVVGKGALVSASYVSSWRASLSYTVSGRLNVARLEIGNRHVGLAGIYGRWLGHSGYEIQAYGRYTSRFIRLSVAGSLRDDSRYTYRVDAVLLPFSVRDIVVVEPEVIAHETPENGWYSAGVELTFYNDLTLGAHYDLGTYGEGVRVSVVWTLWD